MIGTFSSADSALLLIDHQVGTMKLIKNIPLDVVKRNTLALAKTAKILNIPVVLTSSQEQNVQGPLLPELEQILPEAFAARVQRAGIVNAWSDPHFKKAVEATGRRNLIMAGVTTDVCLVYPAISACREGYQVQAVMDASGSPYELSEVLFHHWRSKQNYNRRSSYARVNGRPPRDAAFQKHRRLDDKWERPGHSYYYEVIDLVIARKPQTILAYEMNLENCSTTDFGCSSAISRTAPVGTGPSPSSGSPSTWRLCRY